MGSNSADSLTASWSAIAQWRKQGQLHRGVWNNPSHATLSPGLCKKPLPHNTLWSTTLSPQRNVTPAEEQFICPRTNSKSSLFSFPVPENWYFSLTTPFLQRNSHYKMIPLLCAGLVRTPYLQTGDLQDPQSYSMFALRKENWSLAQTGMRGWVCFSTAQGPRRSLHTRWVFRIAQQGAGKSTWLPIHPSKHWYRCDI